MAKSKKRMHILVTIREAEDNGELFLDQFKQTGPYKYSLYYEVDTDFPYTSKDNRLKAIKAGLAACERRLLGT